MAELELTVQNFGETPNFVAAEADGMRYLNDGSTLVYVRNFSGAAIDIDHVEQNICNFGHPGVPINETLQNGGETRVFHGRERHRFNDGSGYAHFTLTDVSSVTVAVISYYGGS